MPEFTSTILLVLVMGVLFYLLLIRPQQRRAKEQAKLLDALAPGATVMLSSGIIAKVIELGDTQVLVELAPGLEMTVLKQVIINTAATDEFAAEDDLIAADAALADGEFAADDLDRVDTDPAAVDGAPDVVEPQATDAARSDLDAPGADDLNRNKD